jgi:hypothetical protein
MYTGEISRREINTVLLCGSGGLGFVNTFAQGGALEDFAH